MKIIILKSFVFLCLLLPFYAHSQNDPFVSQVEKFLTVEEIPDHQKYIPIANGDIIFFIMIREENAEASLTVAGYDVDGNGVRDDVQNIIIEEYANNRYLMDRTLLVAEKYQKILTGQTSNILPELLAIDHIENCIQKYSANYEENGQAFITPYILNTYQRYKVFFSVTSSAIANNGTPNTKGCE